MGYKPGFGLGKTHTGITAPIEESLQKGRRGLGLSLDGLEKEDVKWEQEEVWLLIFNTILIYTHLYVHVFVLFSKSLTI